MLDSIFTIAYYTAFATRWTPTHLKRAVIEESADETAWTKHLPLLGMACIARTLCFHFPCHGLVIGPALWMGRVVLASINQNQNLRGEKDKKKWPRIAQKIRIGGCVRAECLDSGGSLVKTLVPRGGACQQHRKSVTHSLFTDFMCSFCTRVSLHL